MNVADNNIVIDSKTDITGAGGPGKDPVTTAKTGAYCQITKTYYSDVTCTTAITGFVNTSLEFFNVCTQIDANISKGVTECSSAGYVINEYTNKDCTGQVVPLIASAGQCVMESTGVYFKATIASVQATPKASGAFALAAGTAAYAGIISMY